MSEARSLQKRGTQPTSGRCRNGAWLIYFQLAGQDQAARKVKSKLIVLTYVCLLGFSERAVQVGHPDTVSSEREIFTYLYRSLQGREIRTYFYQLRVREKFLHTSTSGHRVNLPPPPHPQRPTILSGLAGSNGEGGGELKHLRGYVELTAKPACQPPVWGGGVSMW